MAANQKLLEMMELCGHFLHHRRGGKRGQAKILRILAQQGEMTQRQIQDILNIKSGSLSEIVRKMEGDGLITRTKQESDKRNIRLGITEKGMKEAESRLHKMKEQEEMLFDALSGEEQEQLYLLLEKLLHSWKLHFSETYFCHRRS